MTLVVASLVERGIAGVSRSSKKALESSADLVEIRLDRIKNMDGERSLVEEARAAVECPAIATLRSSNEGGGSQLTGKARYDLLVRIADAGFEYIDLESARDAKLLRELRSARGRPRTISSYHFDAPAPRARVKERLLKGCSEADIAKVAMPCADASQAVGLADLALELSAERRALAVMGMGIQGQLTRVCAPGMGSELVYACLEGNEAAPGQLDIRTQVELLQKERVVFGLIGHPVSHSASKPMQEAAMRSVGLKGIYLPLDIPPERMTKEAVKTLFRIGFDGLNVTVPNKQKAYRICDARGASADATAAVNTILRRGDEIVGENTDVIGFERLLASNKVDIKGADALVIGAGGAARAVCKVLTDGDARVTVAARSQERAQNLAEAFGCGQVPYASLESATETYDIVVNATPMGTKGSDAEASGLPLETLQRARVFIDLVYNPQITPSMDAVRSGGRAAHGGLEMLVRQGEEAFRLWTGRSPDVAAMRKSAMKAVSE